MVSPPNSLLTIDVGKGDGVEQHRALRMKRIETGDNIRWVDLCLYVRMRRR